MKLGEAFSYLEKVHQGGVDVTTGEEFRSIMIPVCYTLTPHSLDVLDRVRDALFVPIEQTLNEKDSVNLHVRSLAGGLVRLIKLEMTEKGLEVRKKYGKGPLDYEMDVEDIPEDEQKMVKEALDNNKDSLFKLMDSVYGTVQ